MAEPSLSVGPEARTFGEIVNPSDSYTIQIDDWPAACAAVLLIGEGRYSIQAEGRHMPQMLFGVQDSDRAWMAETFGTEDIGAWVASNLLRVAEALESVVIGDRAAFDVASRHIPSNRWEAFRSEWQDRHRSSLNDIGFAAARAAKAMRATAQREADGG